MNWYKSSQSKNQISIDTSEFDASAHKQLKELEDYNQQKSIRLKNLIPDANFIIENLKGVGYSNPSLLNIINSKDNDSISQEAYNISTFISSIGYPTYSDPEYDKKMLAIRNARNARNAVRHIYDIIDSSEEIKPLEVDLEYTNIHNSIFEKGKPLFDLIQNAVDNAGIISQVVVKIPPNDNAFEASIDSANIEVGGNSFSIFKSESDKWILDDILEAGDEDFFYDANSSAEYFKLINEIRNPGHATKSKILTLYTARPKSDRNVYTNAKEIPSNIFLTKDYDFAENFSKDYGGIRDVWKVRIDSKYLVETYSEKGKEQYQTVGNEKVPVKKYRIDKHIENQLLPAKAIEFVSGLTRYSHLLL